MEDQIHIILVIHTLNSTSMRLGGKRSQKMKLQDYRKQLLIPLNESFALLKDSDLNPIQIKDQGRYLIDEVALGKQEHHYYQIHILENNEVNKKIDKKIKYQNDLQNILKEVEQFQSQKKSVKGSVGHEAKLKRIKILLKQTIPNTNNIDWQRDIDINKTEQFLKSQIRWADVLVNTYLERKIYTIEEMVRRCEMRICRGSNRLKTQLKQLIVDVAQSKFSENADYNCSEYYNRVFQSSSEARQVSQNLERIQSGLHSIGLTVGNIFKAAFNLAGNQNQKKINGKVEKNSLSKLLFGVSIKTAYHIEPAGVVVTKHFKNQFYNIYSLYATEKKKVQKQEIPFDKLKQITQKIKAIIKRFGSQVEVGSYAFGSTFKAIYDYKFQSSLSNQIKEQICNKEQNFSLIGGVYDINMIFRSNENKLNYSVTKSYSGNPPIKNYLRWFQVVENNMDYWSVQFSNTQRISVGSIMQNSKNEIKDELQLFQGFCRLFDSVSNNNEIESNLSVPKDTLSEIICIVGKIGQGKSTFVNQMIGVSLDKPCIALSSVKGVTSEVKSYSISSNSSIQTTIIDTPGIFSNMGSGKNMRDHIIKTVYSDGKDVKIKYVDTIIMIVKITADSRIQIGNQLKEIESIFGSQVYESLLIILNFPNNGTYESKFKECLASEDLARIKKYKNTKFDLETQVFYNIWQSPNTLQYRAHQRQIIKRVRMLKIFRSKDFQSGAMQSQKENRNWRQKQMQEQKKKVQTFSYIQSKFSSCNIRYPIDSILHYLDFGVVKWIPVQRGYNLWKDKSKISLSQRNVFYEKGIIQCKLSAAAEPQKFLSRSSKENNEGLLTWDSVGDTLQIEFERGTQGLMSFCFSKSTETIQINFKNSQPMKYICYSKENGAIIHSRKASKFTIVNDS